MGLVRVPLAVHLQHGLASYRDLVQSQACDDGAAVLVGFSFEDGAQVEAEVGRLNTPIDSHPLLVQIVPEKWEEPLLIINTHTRRHRLIKVAHFPRHQHQVQQSRRTSREYFNRRNLSLHLVE